MGLEHFTLDVPKEAFEDYLQKTTQLLVELHENLDSAKVFQKKSSSELGALFNKPLPKNGQDMDDIFSELQENIIPNATLNIGPYFSAYVMSCSNQMGFMGEIISSFLNQNATKWHLGMAATEIEQVVIKWIKEFMGLPVNSAGLLVSGGSAANLTCLAVARRKISTHDLLENGLFSHKPMVIYTSAEAHHCIIKSAELLGIGRKQVRIIPVTETFQIDLGELEKQIEKDKKEGHIPFCVVANAGTVNTGAIDPLLEVADLCDNHRLWLHIDGAYGGLASSVEHSFVGDLTEGLKRADSIAVDPHKWLYVPIEAGCALFKTDTDALETFSHIPDYLAADRAGNPRKDFMEYGFQLSRNFKALKIWMTFKGLGSDKLKKAIGQDILKARYLKKRIEGSRLFEVVADGPLSIVCYRVNPEKFGLQEDTWKRLTNF